MRVHRCLRRRDRKTTTCTGMREISRCNRNNKTKMLWLRGRRRELVAPSYHAALSL